MTLLAALVVSVVFASSVHLLLGRDLVRMVIGVAMLSVSINLFVMFAGLRRGASPIHPLPEPPIADPVVQALTLTSVVIGSGVTLLVLGLLYRVAISARTLDARALRESEAHDESELERKASL